MTYTEWFKLLNPVKSHPCQIYMWILSYYLHNTILNRIIAINFHYFFIFFLNHGCHFPQSEAYFRGIQVIGMRMGKY